MVYGSLQDVQSTEKAPLHTFGPSPFSSSCCLESVPIKLFAYAAFSLADWPGANDALS